MRRPGLFGALALGAALVAITAAAYPLFLAASQSQLLTSTIADPTFTRYGVGITYRATTVPLGARAPDGRSLILERGRAFATAARANPLLGPALGSLAGPPVEVSNVGGAVPSGVVDGRLFAGDQALQHVSILSGHPGRGVWLPDSIAQPLDAGPGDRIELQDGADVMTLRVDGVYAPLFVSTDVEGFWQPWHSAIYPRCIDCPLPPQFILTDLPVLLRAQRALHDATADEALQAPVRADPPISLDQARGLASFASDLQTNMSDGGTPIGALFLCCRRVFSRAGGGASSDTSFHSAAADVVDVVAQRAAGVQGPGVVLLVAGLTIAFAIIAVAGGFAFASRPIEAGMLRVRGWAPGQVGAKAALEAVLPVVAGAVLGLAAALAIVRALGPRSPLGATALRTSIVGVGIATVASIAIVGVVGAVAFASSHENKERFGRWLLSFPWEIPAFAAAIALGRSLNPGGAVVHAGTQAERPSAAVFLFPLALALAVSIVTARIFGVVALRRSRSSRGGTASARWLAVRRFAASIRLSVVFFIAAALAVTAFVSAQAIVASLRTTVDAKASLFVGADVEVQAISGAVAPTRFPLPITLVQRALGAGTFDGPSGQLFDLVVVDPSTFAGAAYWNDVLSQDSLPDLLRGLSAPHGHAIPIVAANAAGIAPTTIRIGTTQVPVAVVGRAESFPGAASMNPIVVMSRGAVARWFHTTPDKLPSSNSTTELWIRGPTRAAIAEVGPARIPAATILTAAKVKDVPLIVAAVNTFVAVNVLGVVALLLVVVLAIVYVQARQRSRILASALSDRMGASRGTLRRALMLELGGSLFLALAVGVTVGLLAAPRILHVLDPLPTIPPPPISVTPWSAAATAGTLLLVSAVAGGWLAERATRRVSLGTVMRVAG